MNENDWCLEFTLECTDVIPESILSSLNLFTKNIPYINGRRI